jgi:hypothetical protein
MSYSPYGAWRGSSWRRIAPYGEKTRAFRALFPAVASDLGSFCQLAINRVLGGRGAQQIFSENNPMQSSFLSSALHHFRDT